MGSGHETKDVPAADKKSHNVDGGKKRGSEGGALSQRHLHDFRASLVHIARYRGTETLQSRGWIEQLSDVRYIIRASGFFWVHGGEEESRAIAVVEERCPLGKA